MSPVKEYTSRRDRWQAEEAKLQQQFIRIGNARLVVTVIAIVVAWFSFGRHAFSGWVITLPIALFAGLMIWHRRVIRKRTLARRALAYYGQSIDRLDDRWAGVGESGERFRNDAHIYASDLDVFGKGSLFQFLSRARTAAGEKMLADWLVSPPSREETLARQAAVQELSGRLDLREDLVLLGEDIRSGVDPEKVDRWGSEPAIRFSPVLRPLALVLSLMGIASVIAFFAHILPLAPLLAVVACNLVFMFVVRQRVAQISEKVEAPADDLRLFSALLHYLEQQRFESRLLRQVLAALTIEGLSASRRIARLERWVELLESGDHIVLRVMRPIVLWHEQIALAIESWRHKNGSHLGQWLSVIAEFETISSFASLAFERPEWCFPILLAGNEPRFKGTALGHPLLPSTRCVPNDVSIGDNVRLLIVSGSNMSGKSTLLRSIGLNAVLAHAGAPVSANALEISDVQIGASIRVTDSLQDNRSRFFAEISRIGAIVDLAKRTPVLFLLDELLSGTNSHDRLIGATAIVRGLLDSNAIGLITTHDLALAHIERELGYRAVNAHFEDTIVDGRMEFDYRLKPGVVTRSNALELMRAVGLEV